MARVPSLEVGLMPTVECAIRSLRLILGAIPFTWLQQAQEGRVVVTAMCSLEAATVGGWKAALEATPVATRIFQVVPVARRQLEELVGLVTEATILVMMLTDQTVAPEEVNKTKIVLLADGGGQQEDLDGPRTEMAEGEEVEAATLVAAVVARAVTAWVVEVAHRTWDRTVLDGVVATSRRAWAQPKAQMAGL